MKIRGKTQPYAQIEALNLSVVPKERVRPTEAAVIATADENGRFEGKLPMRPRDLIRLRARSPRGLPGPAEVFRARSVEGKPRAPCVATFRIGLRDLGNGSIRVFNINPARPLAEPGRTLWLTNVRTGDRVELVMNANGSLQGRVRVPGRGGDRLRVEAAAAGGRAAAGRAAVVGTLLTPTIHHAPAKKRAQRARRGARELHVATSGLHQKLGFVPTLHRFQAPLFGSTMSPYEVYQSELANCYIASAVAAIAHVRPEVLAKAIVGLGQDRYRVRFQMIDARSGRYAARHVTVTSHLYVRPSGGLLYGSSTNAHHRPITSLWWPVLEKAIARLKGSYKKIGRGGCSHRILEILMGRPPRHFYSDQLSPDRMWTELTRIMAKKIPLVVGTYPATSARKYRLTGLYPDHAYTVMTCREVRGVRKLGLRNPWGEDVQRPGTPRKNGCFEIDFDRFGELIEVISTVRG